MNESEIAWWTGFAWGIPAGFLLWIILDVVDGVRKRRRQKKMRNLKVQFDDPT